MSIGHKGISSPCEDCVKLQAKIEQLAKDLLKYGRHTKGCHSHFIDSSLDRICNTFGKCDCGHDQAVAKAEELLK